MRTVMRTSQLVSLRVLLSAMRATLWVSEIQLRLASVRPLREPPFVAQSGATFQPPLKLRHA
jgi:hypothetical protein